MFRRLTQSLHENREVGMRRLVCKLTVVRQRRKLTPSPDLLEPVLVLPGQLEAVRDMPARGERALMLAVLEMAIRDLKLYGGPLRIVDGFPDGFPSLVVALAAVRKQHWKVRRAHADLIRWFCSDERDYPFAFVSICEAFGLDPGAVRRHLEERGWQPARSPSHMHVSAQQPRQLHGGYQARS